MLHINSNYVLDEIKKISKSHNGNSNITNIIKEDIMKICLEITSVEKLFGKFCSYFNEFLSKADNKELNELYHEKDIPKFFISRKEASIADNDWKWVDQLMYCLRMHFQSIKSYHQFMNKYNLCKDGVEYIGIILQSLPNNYQEANFENINVHLKDCLLIMLNVTDLAEDIFQSYLKITPIYYRIRNTEKMQAKILINCCFDKVEFQANERVLVWHKDFETNLWKVEKIVIDNENVEKVFFNIPSLFLMFDGFDKEIIDNCSVLKRRIVSTWGLMKSEFQKLIINTVDTEIELRELLQIGTIDKTTSYYILDNLIKSLDLDNDQSEKFFEIRHKLADMEYTKHDNGICLMDKWKCLQKIIQLYNDIDLYKNYFKETFNEYYSIKEYLITSENLTYVTMAYISNMPEGQIWHLELKEGANGKAHPDLNLIRNEPECISEDFSVTNNINGKDSQSINVKNKAASVHIHLYESTMKPIPSITVLNKPNIFIPEERPANQDDSNEDIIEAAINVSEALERGNIEDIIEPEINRNEAQEMRNNNTEECLISEKEESDLNFNNFNLEKVPEVSIMNEGNEKDELRKRKDVKDESISSQTDLHDAQNPQRCNIIIIFLGWLLILLIIYLTFRHLSDDFDD